MTLKEFEQQYYSDEVNFIVGCDEAGRGCLLGPVFAAAVILPRDFSSSLINDSKQLTAKQREKAYQEIVEHAIAYGVASIDAEEIDRINILNASRLAMFRAIQNMKHVYDLVITDYMKIPELNVGVIDIPHGDATSLSVAAASIIAKVSRDHWCEDISKQYPLYEINKHKGYGTKLHLEILKKYGPIKGIHRFSYGPVKKLSIQKINLF